MLNESFTSMNYKIKDKVLMWKYANTSIFTLFKIFCKRNFKIGKVYFNIKQESRCEYPLWTQWHSEFCASWLKDFFKYIIYLEGQAKSVLKNLYRIYTYEEEDMTVVR